MYAASFLIVILLSFFNTVQAQNDCPNVTTTAVASVCATFGFFFILLLIYLLCKRYYRKKKRSEQSQVTGYDNIVVVTEEEAEHSQHHENNTKDSKNQLPRNGSKGSASRRRDSHVVTVLLDRKQTPTNGFDVTQNDVGDMIVSSVRKQGPADGKLEEGDVIESITVFFDGITYEDCVGILSKAAAYNLAVSVSQKQQKENESKKPTDVPSLYPKIEKEVDQRTYRASDVTTKEVLSTRSAPETEAIEMKKLDSSTKRKASSSSSSSSSCSEDDVTIIQREKSSPDDMVQPSSSGLLETEKKDTLPSTSKTKDGNKSKTLPEDDESSSSSSSSDEGSFQMVTSGDLGSGNEKPSSGHTEDYYSSLIKPQEIRNVPQSSPVKKTPRGTPSKRREDITFTSGWRKAVKLLDLVRARLVEEETVKKLEFGEVDEEKVEKDLQPYLRGLEPIAGVINLSDNSKMSLYDATKNQTLRRGTAVGLLEAQAATGSIINPYDGEKMSVEEAAKVGLIDPQLAAVLSRAERAVLGFKTMLSDKPLSLFDAMKRKLVMESHGIRLLEAQIATGGIIDPYANHRLPVEIAFERGLFDQRLNKILDDPDDDTKGFFDPNTDENLTYLNLIERCVIDKDTGLRLLPIYKEKQKKDYWKQMTI